MDERLVRDLIAALGASVVNTNSQVGQLASEVQRFLRQGGLAGGGGGQEHGYRVLKPKKEITQITAEDADTDA